ncbi:MAG: phosphatase PAP2 family protein [Kastovskya adunca ATA6-11-RM4]|jgi:membrane-associated phospholipid phosphatase|nr:phosphatase PAP2 family protein [Kastovskya adunca ATA6-11-RM4]
MGIEKLWSPEPIIAFQRFLGTGWERLFEGISLLGSIPAIAIVFALALWLSGRRLAYGLLGAILLATLTDLLIWNLVSLPRPSDPRITLYIKKPVVSSFPSGHTVTATMLWGSLAAFNKLPIAVPIVIVLAMMPARLYLGVHYPGDLLGGVIIGTTLVVLYQRLWSKILPWFKSRPFRFFLTIGLAFPIGALPVIFLSDRGWEVFGVALGAGIGMPLEHWYVHYSPAQVPRSKQALKVGIGLGVLAILGTILYLTKDSSPVVNVVTLALAALWITFLAPALFSYMGLSQPSGRKF